MVDSLRLSPPGIFETGSLTQPGAHEFHKSGWSEDLEGQSSQLRLHCPAGVTGKDRVDL